MNSAPLRLVRLALSGALVGVAIAGLISGDGDRMLYDLLGASTGFVAVFVVKALHIV